MAIGRISGQMLKSNLLRSGTDLAFETNLLVLDVTNSFVGIGTATPARQLHISGTGALRLPSGTDAERGTPANGDIRYNTDSGTIEGYSSGAWTSMVGEGIDNVVEDTTPQLGGDLDVNGQSIVTAAASDADINITPDGTGSVVMSKVDIAAGEIDGTTIGANSAAAGTFTTATATSVNATNYRANDGTAAMTIADSTGNVAVSTNLEVSGNLTVNGTTTTIESTTLQIEDPLLTLAKNNSGSSANTFDQGLFFNRGSDDNVSFIWDESVDQFAFAVTSGEDGTTAGNVTIDSYADIRAGQIQGSTITDGSATLTSGTLTATNVQATNIKANDGTSAITIADSTGVITANTRIEATLGLDIPADDTYLRIGNGNDFTIRHDGTNTLVYNATGSLYFNGPVGSAGDEIVFNSAKEDVDFRVAGDTATYLIKADASVDKVGFNTQTPLYIIDASGDTGAIRLAQGNTAERPSAATGIVRFNSQTGQYEGCQDGSTFVNFQMAGDTPTISKASTTGDGSTQTFNGFFASAPAGANNVLVFIDNVYQEPTENYTVSSTNITFTSAPHSGARIFAITGFDNTAAATGGVARTQTSAVSFESSATTIMNFNSTDYRSAELFVTVTDAINTEYSAMKAVVVHNDSTAYITTYAITNTGAADSVTLTATLSGGTVNVQAVSTGGSQTAKVQYSLQAV